MPLFHRSLKVCRETRSLLVSGLTRTPATNADRTLPLSMSNPIYVYVLYATHDTAAGRDYVHRTDVRFPLSSSAQKPTCLTVCRLSQVFCSSSVSACVCFSSSDLGGAGSYYFIS